MKVHMEGCLFNVFLHSTEVYFQKQLTAINMHMVYGGLN